MNVNLILAFLYPLLLIIISPFFIVRLKVGKTKEAEGGGFIRTGLVLFFVTTLVNLIKQHPQYSIWFIEPIYPGIEVGQFIVLTAASLFLLIGLVLYFSHWGDRDIEVSNHLEKLKILDNIQQECRYPSPVTELLDRVLRSMLGGLEEAAGAVFLLNRSQKKFILVTGVGLGKEEMSLLEYYPYGRNLVTQAIDDETPMISSDFRSLGGRAQIAASKFRSILVIPLISGREKLGAMLFFSEEERHYDHEFISVLTPIGEWLSEKIRVNLLNRDLRKSTRENEGKIAWMENMMTRLGKVLKSGVEIKSANDFTERCLGLADSDEVWLIGLVNGRLNIFGGSGGSSDFADNFRTALVSALARKRPVILNQEGSDESGNSIIARSALLIPAGQVGNAILFRNNGGIISVSDSELKILEMVADVGGMVIDNSRNRSFSSSQSRGLDLIAGILRTRISISAPEKDILSFVARIAEIALTDYLIILFARRADGLDIIYDTSDISQTDLSVMAGEGSIGRSAILGEGSVLFDSRSVSENLAQLDEETRGTLYRLFGEKKTPSFQGDYPIEVNHQVSYVLTVFGFDDNMSNNMEQHRLYSLLVGLLNLRLEILSEPISTGEATVPVSLPAMSGEQVNEINNRLSAITGYCQLNMPNPNLPGETKRALESILKISDELAENIRLITRGQLPSEGPVGQQIEAGEVIKSLFEGKNVSGNLFMIAGRPFTVNLKIKETPLLKIDSADFARLINDTAAQFSETVSEDETITISTYAENNYVHVDISKHRENFPPVETVANFGLYQSARQLYENKREWPFLNLLSGLAGDFAYDRHGRSPSYFSFRLPLVTKSSTAPVDDKGLTILAVDDQAVILDLLAAMCQSMGYKILTARDGREGLKIFESYRPDLLITDLAMPGLSGWELAARVKAISTKTPIILITGWGIPIEEDKVKAAGIDFVLHKPFRLEQLSELINQVRLSKLKS